MSMRAAADLFGRESDIERLVDHGMGNGRRSGLVVLATPSCGASELLRQAYDRIFASDGDVVPFYFEIKPSDITARMAATRFLHQFLLQTVARRRGDAQIIATSPELAEIAELAVPGDGYWIDRLIETFANQDGIDDERAFVRHCVSAPLRAAANGVRPFVMIDRLDLASRLYGGDALFEDLTEIFSRSSLSYVFSGHRRALFARTPLAGLDLDALDLEAAGRFAESLSAETGVAINDQTRDLITVQFGGNPVHIASLFAAAAARVASLDTFEHVEWIYTDELFGGRIGRYFDSIFDEIIPDAAVQSSVIRLLSEHLSPTYDKIPATYWQRHLPSVDAEAILTALHRREIVNLDAGFVELETENSVLGDYIRGRVRLEVNKESRAYAIGDSLSDNIRWAPQLMARHYRRLAALGLGELMRSFDGREVSTALLDYGRFKDELKGASDEKILSFAQSNHESDGEQITLPQIVYTASTAAFYPRMSEICDAERSAVALGFSGTDGKSESVWLAAEIDSKLEAARETAEFWCDRLEMVALRSDFANYTIWLVAPEGFTPDAVEAMRERGAIGSSRRQAELLAGVLGAELADPAANTDNEYEIVLPMGEDTEMIAAHTVEDIARRHNFTSKAINQIKTAVVEACINAAEHSLSPDRKIHQKFSVQDDRIVISISNRGVRLADNVPTDPAAEERRGWGLKLMRSLMDEVTVGRTDDGTQITMTKFLPTNAEARTK